MRLEGIAIFIAGNCENETAARIEFSKRMHLISAFMGWLKYKPNHPGYGSFKPMKYRMAALVNSDHFTVRFSRLSMNPAHRLLHWLSAL